MTAKNPIDENLERLGNFIRSQRQLADLTLRELASRTHVSNPYLSAIERGMHEPSVHVLQSIAHALGVKIETLLCEAGLIEARDAASDDSQSTEAAIRADTRLSDEQKQALLSVYRSYVATNDPH